MYSVKLQQDTDILLAIEDTARQSPKLMQTALRKNARPVIRRLKARLQQEPPPLTDANYPLRWKSPRQRRYVMAKLRRENNLPYQRTHALVNDWEVTFDIQQEGGFIQAVNDNPAADYVIGDHQQPFHIDDGWDAAAEIIVDFEEAFNDVLIETWYTISDPFAGVSG